MATATSMTGGGGVPGATANGTYTQYVYSPGGAKIATIQNGTLVQAVIPLPGGESAVYNSGGFGWFRHRDWLGSSRLATTWTHAAQAKEAYAPFGETYNEAGTPDRSFTGQDQTTSDGNGVYDYLFRKYDPVAGRWLSPDPSGWASVSQFYPQSLNRYAYVQNDPMRSTDPTGLDCIYLSDDSSAIEEVDPGSCVDGDGGYWVPGTYNNLAITDSDGSIVAFESISGGTGYLSEFNSDGSVGLASMAWWNLPSVGSSYTGGFTTYGGSAEEQVGLMFTTVGQLAGPIGTWQGIGTFYAASALYGASLPSLGAEVTTLALESPAASSFALSNAATLDSFAASLGSETWQDYPGYWLDTVQQKLLDPDVTVNVNMTGIDNAYSYIYQNINNSGFAVELNLIRTGAYEGPLQFWSNGVQIASPF
jgi:RHS repeat-associated protein